MSAIKKNLLLLEKDEQVCQEIRSVIADLYHITILTDIGDALPYLLENRENVAVILLGNSNLSEAGKEFLAGIKADIRLYSFPILLIADEQETPEEKEFFTLGVLDCVHKPFHKEAFRQRIENVIRLKESLSYHEVEQMLKELPSNIYLKDAEGRYIFCTQYWHHLNKGDDPNWTVRGKTDIEIRKDKDNAAEAMKADMELIASGKGTAYTIEINEDGIQEFFEVIKEPLKNEQGTTIGIIGLINHVTESEQMKRKLEEIVKTDELTGLYSRYYFDEYLRNIQKKEMYPICIISADCDGLKNINDTYGHLVGDEYIRMVSLLFRMVLPEQGAAFRTGGDEFIILLPSTSEETAQSYIDNMREKEKLFRIRDKKLSVSLGMSSIKSSLDSAEECIAASDMDMYDEKRRKKKKRTDG